MSPSSIRRRLLIGINALIITIVGIGSTALYYKIRQSYYEQIDSNLEKIAGLLVIEIEASDGKVVNDWLKDLDYQKKNKNYIQSWKSDKTDSVSSPDLEETQLPFFHGKLNEYVFRDVDLPHGKRGRAVGILTLPIEDDEDAPEPKQEKLASKTQTPYVLVAAIEIEHNSRRLSKLRWIFILTTIVLVITIHVIITLIIRSSLQPIDDLSCQISKILPDNSSPSFNIAPNFPNELMPLVTHYNKLLERIKLTRERERNFSANAAHELRTPLTGISTTLELALSQPRDSSYYRQSITESLRISESMQKLIERLMSFSKLQSDAYPLHTEYVLVHELLTMVWDENSKKASKRNITAHWKLCPTVENVNTDKLLFLTLFRNMLDNAVSYAPESSEISIETHHTEDRIHLLVRNKTHALKAKDIKHFFDPFYRHDPARTKMENHYGIGLTLCQEIARVLHGGISAHLDENDILTIEYVFQAT